MQPIIRLNGVSFSYAGSDRRALDDIALEVREGEILGIIGPSGAGKSTLAAVLSGAIPHHCAGRLYGAALIDGRDTCEIPLTDIARTVGFVCQDIDAQMVAADVEDELLFGLENFGVPHGEIEARLSGALEAVRVADLRRRAIATLSGGQKQKVAIAAMLALRPRVLVLDEPTAALDPASARSVFATLRQLNRDLGVTVVVIEQAVARLSEFCDRIAVMSRGRIAHLGTPREVFANGPALQALGVDSPRVARASNQLARFGIDVVGAPWLNVDEAVRGIAAVVPAGGAGAGVGAPADARADGARRTGRGDSATARTDTEAAAEPVLEFQDVGFAYPGGAAVHGVSLTVRRGEILALVGQNGAGKTTLTKLANGLLKPCHGTVRVGGLDTAGAPVSQIARHAGTLFQNPDRQICKDTVLEEVAFGPQLHGMTASDARRRASGIVERLGLPEDEAPFTLSRGQRQMVALAGVIAGAPGLVILDEPTSGLDYRECMAVMAEVRELAARGCGVLMVCHDMEVVLDFADRIAVMAQGRLLAEGAGAEIFRDGALMRRAHVEPPQVIALSEELGRRVSPRFQGIHEVDGIVSTCKELIERG